MASIKQALKNRTAYTTKHGLTIPYEELRAMKRLNDQLYYYQKKNDLEVGKQIKIGSLANDTTKVIQLTKLNVKTGQFVRIQKRLTEAEKLGRRTKWLKTRASNIQKDISRLAGDWTNRRNEFDITITPQDIENFKSVKWQEDFNLKKIIVFKDNMLHTLNNQLESHQLPSEIFDDLWSAVNELSAYELHRLATDNPEIIEDFYFDKSGPLMVAHRLANALKDVRPQLKDKMDAVMEELEGYF